MTATRSDIRGWVEAGVKKGATHVIIACDTFDYDNYPVYVMPGEDVHEKFAEKNGKNMQIVDEVYNLSMDVEAQINAHSRVRNF